MKLIFLFFVVLIVVGVSAQRRSARIESSSAEPSTHRSITNRGRAKFTSSPEFSEIADISEISESKKSKPAARRRLDYERHLEPRQRTQEVNPRVQQGLYEVQEVVDDIPRETRRPLLRPRPELKNTQSTTVKTEISSTTEVATEEQKVVQETSTVLESSQESSTTNEEATVKLFTPEDENPMKDIPKIPFNSEPAPVSEISTEPKRNLPRAQLRSRTNTKIEETTTPRNIQRTRATRKPETSPEETSSFSPFRTRSNFRRRPSVEENRRGPSVFLETEQPGRSRTGRKIPEHQKFNRRSDTSEEIEYIGDLRKSGILTSASRRRETIITAEALEVKEVTKKPINRGRVTSEPTTQTPFRTRNRQKFSIDETKLEVLPLFESEAKTEQETAVDSIPEISKIIPESTTPLTSSRTDVSTSRGTPEVTTSQPRKNNRRIPSRAPLREVKSNKIEESRSRRVTTSTRAPSRGRENRKEATTVASITRGRTRHLPEATTELPRRKSTRAQPKKVEPTINENRLQNLAPRRSPPTRRPSPSSPSKSTKPQEVKSTSSRPITRGNSRFNKMEDELLNSEEISVSKSVEKLPAGVTPIPKRSKITKRGNTKDHSTLAISEEDIDESDNYPEPFKALIQAKLKQKESRPRPAEEVSVSSSTDRLTSSRITTAPPAPSTTTRDHKKDEDNELHIINSPPTPKPSPRRYQPKPKQTNKPQNKNSIHQTSTSAPSTSTSKEVLTSVSEKITRQRFHARFKADSKNRQNKTTVANKNDRSERGKSRSIAQPKNSTGLYSSKKNVRSTTPAPKQTTKKSFTARGNAVFDLPASTPEAPYTSPVKPKARFSSKYRSEILRATGFKPSAAPAYVPTVPTVTPYISTSTTSGVVTEENDLGMEIISLDEPVRVSISSANLIRDDYLQTPTTQKTLHVDDDLTRPLDVLSQTRNEVSTRKPVNILESILNAITSTSPPLSSTNSPLRSSTFYLPSSTSSSNTLTDEIIRKRDDNNTNQQQNGSIFERIIESLTQNTTTTTQKPTTTVKPTLATKSTIQRIPKREDQISFTGTPRSVIENILNSLSSIRSIVDTTSPLSPTERVVIITKPTQKKAKIASSNRTGEGSTVKRTTTDKSVRSVTIVNSKPSLTTSTTIDPIHGFLNEISTENTLQKRTLSTLIDILNLAIPNKTEPIVAKSDSIVAPTMISTTTEAAATNNMVSTTTIPSTTSGTMSSNIDTTPVTSSTSVTTISPGTTTDLTLLSKAGTTTQSSTVTTQASTVPFTSPLVTTTRPVTTTIIPESTTTDSPSMNEKMVLTTPDMTSTTVTDQPTTVTMTTASGGKIIGGTTIGNQVSATELIGSNTVTPSSLPELADASTINLSSLVEIIPPELFSVNINSVSVSSANDISSVELASILNASGGSTEAVQNTITENTTPNAITENITPNAITENSVSDLPFELISTTKQPAVGSTTLSFDEGSTASFETTTIMFDSTTPDISSNTIENTQSNNTVLLSSRLKVPELSTVSPNKDYYLFAILPNNTVVRKRPSMYPTKETPFLIVGVYPNNTIIRKFPNGTLVPEEPVIQVRGFDTRPNPPDITSNQVTPERGPAQDNTLTTDGNMSSSTTQSPTLPTLDDVLSGKITDGTTTGRVLYKTLEVDPLTHQVKTDRPGQGSGSSNAVFRWKPVTSPPIVEIGNRINSEVTVEGSASPPSNVVAITPSSSTTKKQPSTTQKVVPSTTKAASSTQRVVTSTTPRITTVLMDIMEQMRQNLRAAIQLNPTTMGPTQTTRTVPSTTEEIPATSTVVVTTASPSTTRRVVTTTQAPTTVRVTTDAPTTRVVTTTSPPTTTRVVTTTRPPTTTMVVTTTKPSTTTRVVTTTRPPTTTRVVTTTKPPTTTRVVTTTRPPTTTRPSTTTRIVTTTRPPTTTKVVTTTRPPTSTTIPSTTTLFTTTDQPTRWTIRTTLPTRGRGSRRFFTTEPTTTQQPSTTQPPTTTRFRTSSFARLQTLEELERDTITPPVEIVTPETTVPISLTTAKTISSTLKTLTTEQKKNLETLAELEKEQAAILKQLSFLTNLIPGGPKALGKPTTSRPSRESATSINSILDSFNSIQSTPKPSTTFGLLNSLTQQTTKSPKGEPSNQLAKILRQYDLSTLKTSTNSPTTTGLFDIISTTTDKQKLKATPKEIEELLRQMQIANSVTTTKKVPTTENLFEALAQRTKQQSTKGPQDEINELLKQYTLEGQKSASSTQPTVSTPYGKSNDAILAAILKEQGIGPNTPRLDIVRQLQAAATRPTTTTPRPGMLMQGLNWLLNRLAPVANRPAPRPFRPSDEEMLTRQPTRLTPVIYDIPDDGEPNSIPSTPRPRTLSGDLQQQEQKEISVLLQQIQAIQKDPVGAQNIVKQFTGRDSRTVIPGRKGDLNAQELVVLLKEIQAIQNDPRSAKNIQQAIKGDPATTKRTTTTRRTTVTTTTTTTTRPPIRVAGSKKSINDLSPEELAILLKQIQSLQGNRSPNPEDETDEFASVSRKPTRSQRVEPVRYNSPQSVDYDEPTKRPALPPVAFRPVNGIPDGESPLRGRLVNAAVSVTRAFTSFLGNAIQGATSAFSSLVGTSATSRGYGS